MTQNTPNFKDFTSKPREIPYRRHFSTLDAFFKFSKVRLPKYCGKRALQGPEKSREMSTYCFAKCGRHFDMFDDVTIYPVLVVAWTVFGQVINRVGSIIDFGHK